MILVVTGPTRSGKTTLAKQFQDIIPNAVVFDDLAPAEVVEQKYAIEQASIQIGMAIVITRNSPIVEDQIQKWMDMFRISLVECHDIVKI